MKSETKKSKPINLDARDGRDVLFEPLDEDRFVLSCGEAVKCAQIGMGVQALGDEIREAIRGARTWLDKRRESILACYATLRDGQILFVVIPSAPSFDFELANDLADLDIEIAEATLCHCEVIQVPAKCTEDLSGFLDPRFLTMVYGDPRST